MLELIVASKGAINFEESGELWLEVANVKGRAVSTYEAHLLPSVANPVKLKDYPRWSEPAGALCTRLLASALKKSPEVLDLLPVQDFCIAIQLVPFGRMPARLLERFDVTQNEQGWKVLKDGAIKVLPSVAGELTVSTALRILINEYWGGKKIKKVVPVCPKVYETETFAYIRTGELPEPARSAFEKNMNHSGRPFVKDAPDAVFSWDWDDFVSGCR